MTSRFMLARNSRTLPGQVCTLNPVIASALSETCLPAPAWLGDAAHGSSHQKATTQRAAAGDH